MNYLKSFFLVSLGLNLANCAMDGDLGKDPRFAFQDKVMDIVSTKQVEDLHAFLNTHPGKRVDFLHYRSGLTPHQHALALQKGPMLLALMQKQTAAKQYQEQLFNAIDQSPQALSDFLQMHPGYDVDSLSDVFFGQTPLERAVELGNIAKVKILQQAGAKLDKGVHTKPLLLVALKNQDQKMLKYLAQFNNYNDPDVDGVDINFRNSEFFWPLSDSQEHKISKDMRRSFYKLFDTRIYKGCSAQDQLSKAAIFGRTQLLDRALSVGAKVNDYDSKGDTALNLASSNARIVSIAHLLEKSADPNIQDKVKGRFALHWVMRMHKQAKQKGARYMSSSELLPCSFLLMAAGSKTRQKDNAGKSVLSWMQKLSVSTQEKDLLKRILNMPQDAKKREDLLADIYSFQTKELQDYIASENIPVPISAGARYFWHRPECIRMKNAWVRKDREDFIAYTPDFKDIYKKYIQ